MNLHSTTPIKRYSASAKEQETVGSFLTFQVIMAEPRRTQYPEIDLRGYRTGRSITITI